MKFGSRSPSEPMSGRCLSFCGLAAPILVSSLAQAQPAVAPETADAAPPAAAEEPRVPSDASPEAAPPPPTPRPLPPPPAPVEEKKDLTALPVTPEFGSDTRSGHLYLALGAGLVAPFGEVARGLEHFARTGPGFAPSFEASYGLGRSVSAGVYGSVALYGGGSRCVDCSSTSVGAGAFVRYHLVTGLRLDPWMSFGLGVRTLSTSLPDGSDRNYAGLEFARAQIGGDWFMTKNVFLGPFLGVGAGTFFGNVPRGEVRDDPESALAVDSGGVHWRFETGLRLGFDFPGK